MFLCITTVGLETQRGTGLVCIDDEGVGVGVFLVVDGRWRRCGVPVLVGRIGGGNSVLVRCVQWGVSTL